MPNAFPETIAVPSRQQLIERLAATNRWAWPWVGLQLVLSAVCVWAIDWQAVTSDPLVTTIAIVVIVGPFVRQILMQFAQKKKEISQLREQTRFGQYDKHRLQQLFSETLRKLNLPNERLNVYITADKYLNAGALHLGLGSFIRSLNGIYLNRQVLHKLEPEEVQDIMGHELGHYYRYYIVADRFRIVTLVLGALVGILTVQWFGMESWLGYVLLLACSYGFWFISNLPYSTHGRAIEYLCDDVGAQVNGVAVSINGLLKISAEMEVLTAIQFQAIRSSKNTNLNAHEVIEAIEAAIPYGHTTREDLEKAVQKSIDQRQRTGATFGGFLREMWQGDVDAEVDEELQEESQKFDRLQSIPRLPWEQLLPDPQRIELQGASLERLIEMIEREPTAELFRLPEALGDTTDVHPPIKMRILYLWRNRHEIEKNLKAY